MVNTKFKCIIATDIDFIIIGVSHLKFFYFRKMRILIHLLINYYFIPLSFIK